MDDDANVLVKIGMSAIIIILMIPGLIIEPGPISEIIGIGSIAAIWGLEEVDV